MIGQLVSTIQNEQSICKQGVSIYNYVKWCNEMNDYNTALYFGHLRLASTELFVRDHAHFSKEYIMLDSQ